jgi:hypothetical protein
VGSVKPVPLRDLRRKCSPTETSFDAHGVAIARSARPGARSRAGLALGAWVRAKGFSAMGVVVTSRLKVAELAPGCLVGDV